MGNVWASNKTIRDFHEFELWHKLLQYGLSPSGEWAMWRIQAAEKTDTLFVRHIASGKEYKYKTLAARQQGLKLLCYHSTRGLHGSGMTVA